MAYSTKATLKWLGVVGGASILFLAGCSSAASTPPSQPTVASAATSAATVVNSAAPTAAALATANATKINAAATAATTAVTGAATVQATTIAAASATVGALAKSATPAAGTTPAAATTPAAGAASGSTIAVATDPKLGQILTDGQGRTLYFFAKDQPGKSNCTGNCATLWPPVPASATTPSLPSGVPGQLGTITRADGTKQLTYDGMPLYLYSKDTKPGDTTGEGFAKVWFVVHPGTSLSTPTATAG